MSDAPAAGRSTLRTDADRADADLRGRTYAIPFDVVWTAALALASGGLPRWTLASADDQTGRIDARVVGVMVKMPATVRVAITLDFNAQTRVDLTVTPDRRGPDLGAARRRVRRFIRALDGGINASPATILDGRSRVAPRGPE